MFLRVTTWLAGGGRLEAKHFINRNNILDIGKKNCAATHWASTNNF
jgi:hypothetical protein